MWQIERWHESLDGWQSSDCGIRHRTFILSGPVPGFFPQELRIAQLLIQSTRSVRCSRLCPTFDARKPQWRNSNSHFHTKFAPENKVHGIILACLWENSSLQNGELGVGKATAAGKLIILIIACLHFHSHFRWPHAWRYLQVFRSLEMFWWSLTLYCNCNFVGLHCW